MLSRSFGHPGRSSPGPSWSPFRLSFQPDHIPPFLSCPEPTEDELTTQGCPHTLFPPLGHPSVLSSPSTLDCLHQTCPLQPTCTISVELPLICSARRILSLLNFQSLLSLVADSFLLRNLVVSVTASSPLSGCKCFFFFFNKFTYFWLHQVFAAAHGLSLVAASGGYSSLRHVGFSLRGLLLLQSTGSRRAGFSSCGTWAQ